MTDPREKVLSAYRVKDVKGFYDEWANSYNDTNTAEGNVSSDQITDICKQFVGFAERILDLGSGTGMVGRKLKKAGFTNIDGLDASPKSLEVARTENIYTNYIEAMLYPDKPCQVETECYDVITCSGCFCSGHLSTEHYDEVFRMVKPRGYVILAINALFIKPILEGEKYFPYDLLGELRKREAAGSLKILLEKEAPYLNLTNGYYMVIKKLK